MCVCLCVRARTDIYGVYGQASCYQYGKWELYCKYQALFRKEDAKQTNQVDGIPECM